MRICILADIGGNIDEGMKVTAKNIVDGLENRGHDLLVLDPRQSKSIEFWRKIYSYSPDVIHYIPGPSTPGYVLGQLSKLVARSTLVISTPLPQIGKLGEMIFRFTTPSKTFVPSRETEKRFSNLGSETVFLPTGVDLEKYHIFSDQRRLRERHNFNDDKFQVLHVGHIKEGRNLKSLIRLQEIDQIQVTIVGSTTTEEEGTTRSDLERAGVDVRREYYQNIEQIYACADLYVFPVQSESNSIQCPASVLESLAVGTPVVSTRFGALDDLFGDETIGIDFIDDDRFKQQVSPMISGKGPSRIEVRSSVLEYGWDNIVSKLMKEYRGAINED